MLQNGLDTSDVLTKRIIRYIRPDGENEEFTIKQLPQKFLNWRRKKYYTNFEQVNYVVLATDGHKFENSSFSINATPVYWTQNIDYQYIDEAISLLEKHEKLPMGERKRLMSVTLAKVKALGMDPYSMVTLLEFGRKTHTYQNIKDNPLVSICTLGYYPTFEFKCIAELCDPIDPNLTERQKKYIEFNNLLNDHVWGKHERLPTHAINLPKPATKRDWLGKIVRWQCEQRAD